jgi:hypothetical protein
MEVPMDYEKTLKQIARTIEHTGREIRRDADIDPTKLNAMSKLIAAYASLLDKFDLEEKEWDYFTEGNPDYYPNLERSYFKQLEERKRQKQKEEEEKNSLEVEEDNEQEDSYYDEEEKRRERILRSFEGEEDSVHQDAERKIILRSFEGGNR